MLVQDFTAGKVLRYDSDGNYLSDFITGIVQPEGFAILPNGNILISERGANRISEFDSNGVLIDRWDNGGTLAGPNFIETLDSSVLNVLEKKNESLILVPSVGSRFQLHDTALNRFESFEIYDVAGNLIETFNFYKNFI